MRVLSFLLMSIAMKTVASQSLISNIEKLGSNLIIPNCEAQKSYLGLFCSHADQMTEADMSRVKIIHYYNTESTVYPLYLAAQHIVKSNNFDKTLPTVICIHGFLDDPKTIGIADMVKELLIRGKINVFALDTSDLTRFFYLRATNAEFAISKIFAIFLKYLVKVGDVKSETIHLVGFSLGAHLAGFTGKEFKRLTGLRLGRITGLDPARPCYQNEFPDSRLDKTDADFVDIIHTNGGAAGILEAIGHADFYPNGGISQTGDLVIVENHHRAFRLFNESIRKRLNFNSIKCNSWEIFKKNACPPPSPSSGIEFMGYDCSRKANGIYYLQTNAVPDFSRGPMGTKYDSTLVWRFMLNPNDLYSVFTARQFYKK